MTQAVVGALHSTSPSRIAADRRAATSRPVGHDLAAVIINYNTASLTLACLRSLARLDLGLRRVLLIDNASGAVDFDHLQAGLRECDLDVELGRNPINLGFAGASDRAIRDLLEDTGVARILLLNSDIVALPGMTDWLSGASGDLCAARVMKLGDPEQIDSLGIVMYRSGIASNRLDPTQPLLGPTAGCAVYSRRLLQTLLDSQGHTFDPDFFCYAEDTDLALRALLLGFEPDYFDQAVALHGGQASSGGDINDFVLYHGIRNSLWVLTKCMPWQLLLVRAPWTAAVHAGIFLQQGRRGRWRVVWQLYRDALMRGSGAWKRRAPIQTSRRIPIAALAERFSRNFHPRGNIRDVLLGTIETTRTRGTSASRTNMSR